MRSHVSARYLPSLVELNLDGAPQADAPNRTLSFPEAPMAEAASNQRAGLGVRLRAKVRADLPTRADPRLLTIAPPAAASRPPTGRYTVTYK